MFGLDVLRILPSGKAISGMSITTDMFGTCSEATEIKEMKIHEIDEDDDVGDSDSDDEDDDDCG